MAEKKRGYSSVGLAVLPSATIKIDLPDKPIYFNFNLNGFTAALNRALSLTNNDDASYFETPKEPSKSKSDASYFEI